MTKIGEKIRTIREIKQISPKEMADKLEMTPQGYLRIERDEVNINLNKIEKIAEIFEIDVAELLHQDERVVLSQIFYSKIKAVNNGITKPMNTHETDESIKNYYEKILQEKDNVIKAKDSEILSLKELLHKVLSK